MSKENAAYQSVSFVKVSQNFLIHLNFCLKKFSKIHILTLTVEVIMCRDLQQPNVKKIFNYSSYINSFIQGLLLSIKLPNV